MVAVGVWLLRPQAKDPAASFETTAVQRRDVESRVTATGTVSALVTVQVGSQVSGRIQEILVDFNSPVKKGQVIARIDPQLLQAAVEQARANLTAARANLQRARVEAENAHRQAERSKAAARRSSSSPRRSWTPPSPPPRSAQAQVTSSEATLAQAQAALNQAEVNLRYTTIVSPIDGIVISRSVDVGQTVAASLQAPTLFTIAEDLRKMQVDTSVAEADVGRLQAGMRATFTVDAFPGEQLRGCHPADPQRPADGAERRHLRRRHRRRQPGAEAQAGHDGQRHLRHRAPGERADACPTRRCASGPRSPPRERRGRAPAWAAREPRGKHERGRSPRPDARRCSSCARGGPGPCT